MLAYVDENGELSSTPPEIKQASRPTNRWLNAWFAHVFKAIWLIMFLENQARSSSV
jgi:hypothetical protein